ncbi:MAG: BON domain-containing protein [Ktedonobacteraceae bacterium]|nr:BON domain-containing protein [Ktedonobacteraceae bacterium]
MEKSTLISEMEKFHFGSKVFCSNGESGTVTHLGFDAGTRRLVSIGVKHGRLFGKTVYVPFSTVVEATGVGVTLNITQEQLFASTAQAEGVVLDNRSVVQNTDANAKGTLSLVAVHPDSGALAYIVVHTLRPGQDTLLREGYITKIDAGQIGVSIPDATLHTLPAHRSDEELQREVESVLFDFTPLHVDLPGMIIRVLDSVLYLEGNISSSLRGDIVEDQVSGVQGLLEIKNLLVGDDILAGDLAMALGRDERTHDLPIGVYPRLGAVRLSGAVHNEQQKAAAEEIARSFQGVRSVFNDLVIRPNADILNVMASSAGGEAADHIPGKYIRHTK